MKHSIFIMFVVVLLCLGAAAAETCGDYEYEVLEGGYAAITQYTGNDGTVTIPEELDGHPVAVLGYDVFAMKEMTAVSIPDSVTRIYGNPFWGCENLTEIILSPDHPCLEIKDGALISKVEHYLTWVPVASADTYTIPEGIQFISDKVFFQNRTLQSVTIPGNVRIIGNQVFEGCEALGSVRMDEGLESIGYAAFSGCAKLTDIHIPESVTEIDPDAFVRCSSLTEVHIPDAVTSIGNGAFYECTSLQTVRLPEALTKLERLTFYGCESLSGITIPAGVTSIDVSCFENCKSLTEIEIPEGVKKISQNAFKGCVLLEKAVLPSSLTHIGDTARDRKTKKNVLISPFEGCESISFVVPRDSEAEEFCKLMEYPYDYLDEPEENNES